jgi:hypothetical protein
VYRDDVCAVCGESLPPDHFYCREHGSTVDDRLHQAGVLLERLTQDVAAAAHLLGGIAQETWDYLAESQANEPLWPPRPRLDVTAHGDDVDVDVDTEPGRVRVRLDLSLTQLLDAVASALSSADASAVATACRTASGANATH